MADLREDLTECCRKLRLSYNLAERAMLQGEETEQQYLYSLLQGEIQRRHEERTARYMNTAGFPRRYSTEQFRLSEIEFPEGATYESLLNLEFYREGKNIIMYGGTGTGKTMLSILIGMSACNAGIPVKFFRTAALINKFSESHAKGTLSAFRKKLMATQIIILDEFGYVPYDRTGAQLLFDFLSEIHEEKSVILNTNLEFSQWVNVLYDSRMTAALIGRLTHHVDLILFPGGNNRLRESSINTAFSASGKAVNHNG